MKNKLRIVKKQRPVTIPLESVTQGKIIKHMEMYGWIANRTQGMRISGWPDIECFREGEVLFIEVKRSNQKLSDAQEEVHEMLRNEGFKVCVWNEDDERLLRSKHLPPYLKETVK